VRRTPFTVRTFAEAVTEMGELVENLAPVIESLICKRTELLKASPALEIVGD
jgi:hypothetical protein